MTSVNLSMLHSLKPFQCPNCNVLYSAKDAGRFHHVARFPRILSCCHSVCEKCLQAAEKNSSDFSCPTCKESVNVAVEDLLPDVHALGIISANIKNCLPSLKVKMVPASELKRNHSQDSLKKPGPTIICGQCNKTQALWHCDECQLNFCSLCFKEIHDNNQKKKHEAKKIFAELYNSMVQEGCPDHENKAVEFFCEVDNQLTCSYCMLMGSHVGHQVKTLVDKNKSCAEDLKSTLEEITSMQKHLKYTDHLLSEIIPKEQVDISDTIKNVHNYFHKLHTTLQAKEAELISEITEISQKSVKPLEEMKLSVASCERELASVKKDAESVIENPCLAVSAPAVLKKLQESKDMPCYLVPIIDEAQKKFCLNVNLESDLEQQIKEFGEIHFDVKPRFVLLPSSELPECFCKEIPDSFNSKLQALDTESCSTSIADTFSEDSLSVTTPPSSHHSSMLASHKCRDFAKLQPEKVMVSHVRDPSKFFVQRFCELKKLIGMSEAIDKWCKCYESKKSKVTTVQTGDLYLVRYGVDNKWYRGRVKRVLPSESDEFEDKVIGIKSPVLLNDGKIVVRNRETRVEVFYIDYGNTEITTLSNMKNILARFLNLPGLSKECCLADIEPANGKKWCLESAKTFNMFVKNKPVVMQVLEERNNVLYVDLNQVADNDISSDVPVSVRDALVFLELAVFSAGKTPSQPFGKKKKKTERTYLPPESLCMNVNICAIVSHVESPSHIYVQQMSTASYLSRLIYEMNEAYKEESNSMLHAIYAPRIGMVCAAQFSIDKQWYRAQVMDLPGGAKVKVQYVDFGNTEVVHHRFLRKLFDKFFKLNIQAIPCKLAHVTYNQSNGWSDKAKQWLTKQVSRKQLILKSLGMIPGENKTEVVLYYVEDDSEICVNALMVEQELAESTGELSAITKRKRESTPIKIQSFLPGVSSLHEMVTAAIPPPVPKFTQMLVDPNEVTFHMKSQPPSVPLSIDHSVPAPNSPKKKYPSLVSPPLRDIDKHIEVHVSHIETPGHFYIRLAGDNEKKLNSLMNELQSYYEKDEGEPADCSVGKAYAVFNKTKKKWFRGTVLSKLSDDKVEIHYVDYGNKEEVEKESIRKLMEKFTADESFSVRCHLDGVNPAGDSNNWSHSASDQFKQLVSPHDVLLLSSKGEVDQETKSLPSDLLIENLIRGGALEPTKMEYISITSELIKHGYGLPVRKKCASALGCTPTHSTSVEPTEHTESNNNGLNKAAESQNQNISSYSLSNMNCFDITNMKACPVPVKEDKILVSAKPTFQWKTAVPPLEPVFQGYVTNIGDDGSIHLFVVNKGVSQVDTIRKALEYKYAKSDYQRLNKAPPVGEACIAKFAVDNEWYRAEVISVYPGRVKVNFVDYGNNEILNLRDIRMDIIMKAFPRQCLECALIGVDEVVNGKWDKELLTFLHNQLVETEVLVEVQAPPDEKGRLQCRISTAAGINVAELLLSMGFGEDLETTSMQEKTVESVKTDKAFTGPLDLREGYTFPVCVTQVFSEKIVCLQILKIDEPKDEYELQNNKIHDAFLQLISELNEKADSFPILKEPLPGMVGCAKYTYDNSWYRCEVTDLQEDSVVVLYVDYGNSETISNDSLRELDDRFIEFPLQIHFCELNGLKPVGDTWDPQVKEILVKTLLVEGKPLYARVMMPGKISQMDLLVKDENGEFKLAYVELLEKNLISLDRSISV